MEELSLTTLGIFGGVQIITFLVLVLLLRRLVFSASANELQRLRNLSLENQKKAEHLSKELEKAEREHQRRVEKAESELRELKDSAREDSERQKDKTLHDARSEGDKIINQALKAKERIRAELEGELEERCTDLACRLIKHVLTEERMKWFHDGLIDDVIAAIGKMDSDALKRVNADAVAEIRTPCQLSSQQQKQLGDALSRNAGKPLDIKPAVDQDVIAGVTIRVGNIMIDGSLAGKLQQSAAAVLNEQS